MARLLAAGLVVGAAAAAFGGCAAPRTKIPTYWDPVLRPPRPKPVMDPPPPVVAEVAPRPEPPPPPPPVAPAVAPAFEVEEAPEECMAIYAVSAENRLLAFQPQQNRFEVRAELDCPTPGWASPFSMAVDREGTALVLLSNGQLVKVDLADGACELTPYKPGQQGFWLFGMGYAPDGGDDDDDAESLFVTHIPVSGPSAGLARIDTETWRLDVRGTYSEPIGGSMELTPSGDDGPLFGYALPSPRVPGTLVEIDAADARVVRRIPVGAGTGASSLAVAWWGGRFFIFTGEPGFRRGTTVHRYDPVAEETKVVARFEDEIVGAAVSTCAPDRKP